MNVNVKSMMLCYKTAANQMVKQQEEDKKNNIKANYRIIGSSISNTRRYVLNYFQQEVALSLVLLARHCAELMPRPSLLSEG
jgi:hypothetical protein